MYLYLFPKYSCAHSYGVRTLASMLHIEPTINSNCSVYVCSCSHVVLATFYTQSKQRAVSQRCGPFKCSSSKLEGEEWRRAIDNTQRKTSSVLGEGRLCNTSVFCSFTYSVGESAALFSDCNTWAVSDVLFLLNKIIISALKMTQCVMISQNAIFLKTTEFVSNIRYTKCWQNKMAVSSDVVRQQRRCRWWLQI
jgi:hypothetical protein